MCTLLIDVWEATFRWIFCAHKSLKTSIPATYVLLNNTAVFFISSQQSYLNFDFFHISFPKRQTIDCSSFFPWNKNTCAFGTTGKSFQNCRWPLIHLRLELNVSHHRRLNYLGFRPNTKKKEQIVELLPNIDSLNLNVSEKESINSFSCTTFSFFLREQGVTMPSRQFHISNHLRYIANSSNS